MRAYSMDLQERALLDSDAGMTAADVAAKYRVSGSWVRLLKQRRRETGEVAPRVQRHGRRGMLEPHLHTLADLIAAHPDRTLAELKDALATPANDRAVELRVTDRVPLEARHNGRLLDVSDAAARPLEMVEDGVVPVGMSAHGRDYRLGYRLGAAPRQPGSLLASSWRPRGRCRVAPAPERGRGRSTRAYCGGGRLTGCCRDSDRPHAPRPGPPAAAAHHRQSGDPDRIPAARRAQRPAHGRPLRASDRHHRAPGISRSWPQNGRIPAQ